MTEAEWSACTQPAPMLEFLQDKVSDRKLRLLTCGMARYAPAEYLTEEIARTLQRVEAFADGDISLDAMNQFRGILPVSVPQSEPLYYTRQIRNLVISVKKLVWQSALQQAALTVRLRIENELGQYHAERNESWQMATRRERLLMAALIRDLFGSQLFRPAYIESAWLTTTVVGLADGVYADRAFDRLPILADALEEAGCDNADILTHCRGDGPHVRGCWVVDLLLGKE